SESRIEKTYHVLLKNSLSDTEKKEYMKAVEKGLYLAAEKKSEAFMTRPARLEFLSDRECRIVISEGRFHEVRRIFSALGNEVEGLKRIAVGKLNLDEKLGENEFRSLREDEIQLLLKK
ncbi:MAG: rRNA pseudouridine synthase, partial [Treponemataceae bacterium]|nr:rRNA pseudouridine synthase [Treponemataceae bacterium]